MLKRIKKSTKYKKIKEKFKQLDLDLTLNEYNNYLKKAIKVFNISKEAYDVNINFVLLLPLIKSKSVILKKYGYVYFLNHLSFYLEYYNFELLNHLKEKSFEEILKSNNKDLIDIKLKLLLCLDYKKHVKDILHLKIILTKLENKKKDF